MVIATFFGIGFSPIAPGTAGSLATCIIFYFSFLNSSLLLKIILFILLMPLSIITSYGAELYFGREDAGEIVIDEVVGMLIPLIISGSLIDVILSFVLFRIFDILKPYPVNLIDVKLKGGTGVVMDDVAAGIYSLICLGIIKAIIYIM